VTSTFAVSGTPDRSVGRVETDICPRPSQYVPGSARPAGQLAPALLYDGAVPMRMDCKHYESRTYANGDSVRKCDLDLAPEAPWRCPPNCPAFAPRLADAGWAWGGLAASSPTPAEPPRLDEHAAALLDQAEDIVNAVGPEILAEFKKANDRRAKSWWSRLQLRRRRR
jgi:hypothetical protein